MEEPDHYEELSSYHLLDLLHGGRGKEQTYINDQSIQLQQSGTTRQQVIR